MVDDAGGESGVDSVEVAGGVLSIKPFFQGWPAVKLPGGSVAYPAGGPYSHRLPVVSGCQHRQAFVGLVGVNP